MVVDFKKLNEKTIGRIVTPCLTTMMYSTELVEQNILRLWIWPADTIRLKDPNDKLETAFTALVHWYAVWSHKRSSNVSKSDV